MGQLLFAPWAGLLNPPSFNGW